MESFSRSIPQTGQKLFLLCLQQIGSCEKFSVGWNNGVREKKIKLQPERYGLIDLAKQGALLSSHELSEEQEMTEEGMAKEIFLRGITFVIFEVLPNLKYVHQLLTCFSLIIR